MCFAGFEQENWLYTTAHKIWYSTIIQCQWMLHTKLHVLPSHLTNVHTDLTFTAISFHQTWLTLFTSTFFLSNLSSHTGHYALERTIRVKNIVVLWRCVSGNFLVLLMTYASPKMTSPCFNLSCTPLHQCAGTSRRVLSDPPIGMSGHCVRMHSQNSGCQISRHLPKQASQPQ